MKTAILISLVVFFATTSNAQCTGCWGQNDTAVLKQNLSTEDKQALRLYSKLQWYDFSTYKFKGEGKRAVWIAYAAAGILHGGREAYHAEPTVFEKRFGVAPQSFFGSEQWKRNYFNRDPESGHKPNLFNPVRDYYHFSGATTKAVWIGGAFVIGTSEQPIKYKLVDLLIGTLITSGTASLTYNILR